MMTSAQVVEMSVTVTDNSPFQDYDHTTRPTVTPGFKPFTVQFSLQQTRSGLQDQMLRLPSLLHRRDWQEPQDKTD